MHKTLSPKFYFFAAFRPGFHWALLLLFLPGCAFFSWGAPSVEKSQPAHRESQSARGEGVNPLEVRARIRYAEMEGQLSFQLAESGTLQSAEQRYPLAPGAYTLTPSAVRPAAQQYHVFSRTFAPSESDAMNAYIKEWREKNYAPEVVTFGLLFHLPSGRKLDNRRHWISLARCATEQEAKAMVDRLKGGAIAPWIRAERISPGHAHFSLQTPQGKTSLQLSTPLTIESSGAIEVVDVSSSFWKERKANRFYAAPLDIGIGPESAVEVFGTLAVEEYLRGVVPAEMPSQWPLEALKAQALVARSEIYASLAGKYKLQGFDFTTLESCRAYWGQGEHHPTTDEAVRATAGEALSYENQFAATVFSSSCGGWTENNDTVWSGPPTGLLRGGSDLRSGAASLTPSGNINRWLGEAPAAWCDADETGYRWKRRFTNAELTTLINKKYKIGTIRSIEEGPRGVSGRLKSVTIAGSSDKVTIDRELAIRQAFGGLPSAMIIIRASHSGRPPTYWEISGGGRGHGVGLCQHGSRGMAAAGLGYNEIVAHYFSSARIERTR